MSDYLFHPGDLVSTLEANRKKIGDVIEALSEDYVLKVNEPEYIKHMLDEETILPLAIVSDAELVGDREVQRERVGHFGTYIDRLPQIEVSLAYSGERQLFKLRANPFSEPLKGKVLDREIRTSFVAESGESSETIRKRIDRWVQGVRRLADEQKPYLDSWNRQLEQVIRCFFTAKKERHLKKNNLVAAIGLPLRQRHDPLGTYSVSISKRINTTPQSPPSVPPGQFQASFRLEEGTYQEILGHLRHMSQVIERDPAAFGSLGEESLRAHFLMHLNGTFQGQASGETFSMNGKTDIYLRVNDRAIFIAECKFWTGPSSFGDIIDQLTGYLTWRDTKTAILVFVKNADITQVIDQIPGLVSRHRLFTKREASAHQGEFRFTMRNAQDESLPLILTVMCFHMPETTSRRGKKPV